MSNIDTRQVNRDSLFLLAQLRVDGQPGTTRVKVRNLSAGGMMAEGEAKVVRGTLVAVELRNIGWVDGSVAWRQDNRFGIAFVDEIDPAAVRAPGAPEEPSEFEIPRYTRNHQALPLSPADRERLRKL
jgi:prepilin-type processing-associated H-X9-DG protein